MNIGRIITVTLILGLFLQVCVYAEQPLKLEAKEGFYQFPFFDTKTPVWSYNGQIPGPLIRGRVGTTLVIDFANRLKEPSSIHWHGLRIENAMDGVPGVTQDPVGPGENFEYRLKLEDAGTFWYHPHFNSSEQLERGLKGVFIVEEAERQPWSQDWVWLMDDWLLQKDGTIYPHFNTGRDLMHDGRWGNAPTINGKFRPEYQIKPGERIRLRLINGANARIFSRHIQGLPADVIAIDGKPVTQIFPLKRPITHWVYPEKSYLITAVRGYTQCTSTGYFSEYWNATAKRQLNNLLEIPFWLAPGKVLPLVSFPSIPEFGSHIVISRNMRKRG
jgi:hypothetical protein